MFGEGKSQTLGSSVGAGSGTYRNTSGTTASNTTSQQNVRVTPSTTVVQLNMDSANVGNAMARSNYRISSNIKQFGGTGIDASATV